jgi:hypothetical protein
MVVQGTLLRIGTITVGIFLVCFGANSAKVLASENDGLTKENLLEWRDDVNPWYERYFYYTAWPKEKEHADLKERPDIPYSFESWVTEVMKKGVLDEDWNKKILRVKNWIRLESGYDKKYDNRRFDAYLYRQHFKDGVLHICDTRSNMVVALTFGKNKALLEDSRVALHDTMRDLFAHTFFDDPAKVQFREDPKTGMLLGDTAHGFPPGMSAGREKKTAFGLNYTVGKRIAIFEFGKWYVPGCELGSRFPLFGDAPPEFFAAEHAKGKIESFADPNSADIPALIKLLAELPEGPNRKLYEENPYVYRTLLTAKLSIITLLEKAVESIKTEEDEEIVLIRMTLQAENYISEPEENPQRSRLKRLKRAVYETLREIGTEEAGKLYFDLLELEEPHNRQQFVIYLDSFQMFRERYERFIEEDRMPKDGEYMDHLAAFELLRKEWRATVPSSLGQMKRPGQVEQPSEQLENEEPNVPASKGPNGAARKYMGIILAGVLLIVGLLLLQKKKASSRSK